MKKLIAISVVFALVAGVTFAVDLGGSVIGTVNVIQADSDTSGVTGGGEMNQLRVHGSGELEDGKFGAYIRLDGVNTVGTVGDLTGHSWEADQWITPQIYGYAWWKPIDQLKLIIGQQPDGFFEQNGNACWGFYQHIGDTGVVNVGNAWGGGYAGPFYMRNAFAEGFSDGGLAIAITPVDIVEINIGIPFISNAGDELGDIFKSTFAQIALNMSFGTVAFTYRGRDEIKKSEIFGFFALKAIDNLQLDFGLGTNFQSLSNDDRLNIGLAVKYTPGSWGLKFRTLLGIPVKKDDQQFGMFFDILPYFVINDSFRVYISGGVSFFNVKDLTDGASWHVNPYIEVGGEWGPKFAAGIKVWQVGDLKTGSAPVNFALPVALRIEF